MATSLVRVQGRQFPLHVLEPVEDLVFDKDEALVEAIVQLVISAAALDMVSTLVFVRGKGMVERIAAGSWKNVRGTMRSYGRLVVLVCGVSCPIFW